MKTSNLTNYKKLQGVCPASYVMVNGWFYGGKTEKRDDKSWALKLSRLDLMQALPIIVYSSQFFHTASYFSPKTRGQFGILHSRVQFPTSFVSMI
jgi:hypothetical protein